MSVGLVTMSLFTLGLHCSCWNIIQVCVCVCVCVPVMLSVCVYFDVFAFMECF